MRDCHPDRLMPCFQQALGLAGEGDVGVVINHLLAPRLSVVWGWQSVFGADLALPAAAGVRRTAFSSTASTTARSPPAPPGQVLSDFLGIRNDADLADSGGIQWPDADAAVAASASKPTLSDSQLSTSGAAATPLRRRKIRHSRCPRPLPL